MTRVKHPPSQGDIWQALFNELRTMLTAVAEMLLNCCAAPEQILDEAMKGLKGSPVRDPFGPISAVRAVVKAAIARNKAAAILRVEPESADLAKQETFGTSTAGILPWPERAVYFLREDLRYSRRDTALLLGMSDANIDQLYEIAQNGSVIPTPHPSLRSYFTRGAKPDRPMAIHCQEGSHEEFQLLFESHRREPSDRTLQLAAIQLSPD